MTRGVVPTYHCADAFLHAVVQPQWGNDDGRSLLLVNLVIQFPQVGILLDTACSEQTLVHYMCNLVVEPISHICAQAEQLVGDCASHKRIAIEQCTTATTPLSTDVCGCILEDLEVAGVRHNRR